MATSISVIIPAFNAEREIGACLEGIIKQTLAPFEIIVVDDGSQDQTLEKVRSYGVTCVGNTGKKGPGGARNTGAGIAKGEILAFTDSDCIPPENWLATLTGPLEGGLVGAVGSGYCSGSGNGFWQRFCWAELAFRRRRFNHGIGTLVSNNLACRKETFHAIGGFPEDYPVCEDMLFSHRIARRYKVLWLPEAGVVHHFKDSFYHFMQHQYRFGKESARFFLMNPVLLKEKNHQGRRLHATILCAGLLLVSLILFCLFFCIQAAGPSQWLLGGAAVLLLIHFGCYLPFLRHLSKYGIVSPFKGYLVSLSRDMSCFFSAIHGLCAFIRSRKRREP